MILVKIEWQRLTGYGSYFNHPAEKGDGRCKQKALLRAAAEQAE